MEKVKIHFLNTIWSDAIILENNNHYAFIDTASDFYYPMIKNHLKQHNIIDIDFILLTHFHGDHYGNVSSLIKDYNVKTLYMKRYYGVEGSTGSGAKSDEKFLENEKNNYNKIILSAKENNTKVVFINDFNSDIYTINFNNVDIELYKIQNDLYNIYTNKNSKYYNQKVFNENHNSIGVFFKVNDFNIFMGSDLICLDNELTQLDNSAIKIIKEIYKRHNINHIDLYKSNHHGHFENNPYELVKLINPTYTIITNSPKWTDNYSTIKDIKKVNPNAIILHTDYHKYIFDISNEINYQEIKEESLFITLKKE